MTRERFDPEQMRGGDLFAGAPADEKRAMRVRDLAGLIDRALREGTPRRVRVVGEVSGFTDRTHWYFSLKDEDAVVSCVAFASVARKAGFTPETGQEVLAEGRVEFYAKQGRTQFYVERIEPVGAGALELRYRALCEKLRQRGWFAPEHKRPLPRFPRRVAVVTSRTGAALADVLDTLGKRAPWIEVLLVDVRVQGERAAPEIARAIGWLSRERERLGLDGVILTRGGGSMEDLWAFNEEAVAAAVWACEAPIVAAIGHETDTTIAELVADERAATPTQAAMRLSPDRAGLQEQLTQLGRRLGAMARRHAQHEGELLATMRRRLVRAGHTAMRTRRHDLDRLALAIERKRPDRELARRREALAAARTRLETAVWGGLDHDRVEAARETLVRRGRRLIERTSQRAASLERELWAIGPAQVLARGYSVTRLETGAVIRSTGEVAAGDEVETVVGDGAFRSVVGGADAEGRTPPPTAAPARRKRAAGIKGQMGLFGSERPDSR